MKKVIAVIIFLLLIKVSYAKADEQDNYCHDVESWTEWNAMVKKYPDDIPLQMLHALRIGLCKKIEEKSITFEEANQLMNNMSDKLIEERMRTP
jgi:hypothetical protein